MIAIELIMILFLLSSVHAWNTHSRRRWVENCAVAALTLVGVPARSNAARGAAELDFEYYVRAAVTGNRKEGSAVQSALLAAKPSRVLGASLVDILIDNSCSLGCLVSETLAETINNSKTSRLPSAKIEELIQEGVVSYREGARGSFFRKAPWQTEDVKDQYFFDLTCYALWRAAADILSDYKDRDYFVRRLGHRLYDRLRKNGLVRGRLPDGASAVGSIPAVVEILELLRDQRFCTGYRLGQLDKSGSENNLPFFDELDDEALEGGATIDAVVSIFEPATLGASLQITGEQSRFIPDIVGGLLAAVWKEAGIEATWEVFFVDSEYRPNPKDYFPNEQLLQFTLKGVQRSSS